MDAAHTHNTAKATTSQPQAASQMNVMSAPAAASKQEHIECKHKANRLRGGGAGKDCLLGCIGCFLCFECCEDCCDCFADIVCCPCEMCC
ncbi:hypothetical protein PLICRDRAFT_39238 [Plicaturopsis crispa FD-325 SS-3]|nr:hypothetical protein PLICRDRAFT_39238 [Plicaturopsis crispa FD-325 SS-3]